MRQVLVWGAGRIGRGFSAEVFSQPGFHVSFVDVDAALCDALRGARSYTIFKTKPTGLAEIPISGFDAYHAQRHADAVGALLMTSQPIVAVAVHAPILPEVMAQLAPHIARRAELLPEDPIDILLNVNMVGAGAACKKYLRDALSGDERALAYAERRVGMVETMIMRISPHAPEHLLAKDPLAVLHSDFPEMPADAHALRGEKPVVPMLRLSDDIHAEECRKIYTLNMAHALLSYLAGARFALVLDAARDAVVRGWVEQAFAESSVGLCGEFGFSRESMRTWCAAVMDMLLNPYMEDQVARLGADARRKLSRDDRLVGPAMLCIRHGGTPDMLARAIAAGFRYQNDDPGTRWVNEQVQTLGLARAIEVVCGLSPSDALHSMILRQSESFS